MNVLDRIGGLGPWFYSWCLSWSGVFPVGLWGNGEALQDICIWESWPRQALLVDTAAHKKVFEGWHVL